MRKVIKRMVYPVNPFILRATEQMISLVTSTTEPSYRSSVSTQRQILDNAAPVPHDSLHSTIVNRTPICAILQSCSGWPML